MKSLATPSSYKILDKAIQTMSTSDKSGPPITEVQVYDEVMSLQSDWFLYQTECF